MTRRQQPKGTEMNKHSDDWVTAWMKPGYEAFEYWISFFPTAPMFGVPWRFGDVAMGFGFAMPKSGGAFDPIWGGATRTATSGKTSAKTSGSNSGKTSATSGTSAKRSATGKPSAGAVVDAVAEPVAEAHAPAKPAPKAKTKARTADAGPTDAGSNVVPIKAEGADGSPTGLMAAAPADADDLKMIKGVGPQLEKQLNALGVYKFDQLASFGEADFQWIDDNLTSFKGRWSRDDWGGQAKALMQG